MSEKEKQRIIDLMKTAFRLGWRMSEAVNNPNGRVISHDELEFEAKTIEVLAETIENDALN